ncbi:MAG: SMP-30/gluconolactonase/LRE family protein [Paracoccaceae bacterium]
MIYDDRTCTLGEGPLWHPQRGQLFWFDIVEKKLLSRKQERPVEWAFDQMVSAAGIIDENRLLIASEIDLRVFDLSTGKSTPLCDLEADNSTTRSNDGRADPQGGFWIGTMGMKAQPHAGSIWRWYGGEMRRLYRGISIANTICFAPDGTSACFADTATGKVMRVALDLDGWPISDPELFLDLASENLNPDGAVIDSRGIMWMAQWGAARVASYAPDGTLLTCIAVEAPHTSCPAFGGHELTTLYVTTALQEMSPEARVAYPKAGSVFSFSEIAQGKPEYRVKLL